jgi:hypothetical protein
MTLDAFAAPFIYVEHLIWLGGGVLIGAGIIVALIVYALKHPEDWWPRR